MAASKVSYYGKVLIDLTQDTVTAEKLAKGVTAHGKDGAVITGTMEIVKEGKWMKIPAGIGKYEEQYIHAQGGNR